MCLVLLDILALYRRGLLYYYIVNLSQNMSTINSKVVVISALFSISNIHRLICLLETSEGVAKW